MNDPQVRFEQLIAKLKERQYRITPQRVELIRLIAASEGHPSASQLYNQIKVQFPGSVTVVDVTKRRVELG
mgnify:CR=1 FL=1